MAQRGWSLDSRWSQDYPLYLASSGEGALEFLFVFAMRALKRAEGGAEEDGEWMGGRSGSTARGRWSFFRHSHLLSVQLRSLRQCVGPLSFGAPFVGILPAHSPSKFLLVPYLVPETAGC